VGLRAERSKFLGSPWTLEGMKFRNQDPEAYRQRLEAKLRPLRIRATLAFAGLYHVTHELIKAESWMRFLSSTGRSETEL